MVHACGCPQSFFDESHTFPSIGMNGAKKWFELSTLLQEEGILLASRNTPENMKHLYDTGRAVIKEHDGRIVAFSALWPLEDHVSELGSVWVHPELRGIKLGSEIFTECLELALQTSGLIFLITHEPKVVHLVERAGWIEPSSTLWENSPGVCSSKSMYERVIEHRKNCKLLAEGEPCRIFFSTIQ